MREDLQGDCRLAAASAAKQVNGRHCCRWSPCSTRRRVSGPSKRTSPLPSSSHSSSRYIVAICVLYAQQFRFLRDPARTLSLLRAFELGARCQRRCKEAACLRICAPIINCDGTPACCPIKGLLAQDDPPKPRDRLIVTHPSPASEMYVSSFGGFATQQGVLSEAAKLQEAVKEDGHDVLTSALTNATVEGAYARWFQVHTVCLTNRSAAGCNIWRSLGNIIEP